MRTIDADALLDEVMDRHCNDCDRRKGIKNGKYRITYSIGEAPCRACDVDDLKDEIEYAPTIEPRCEECEAFNKTRLLIPQPERKKGKWIEQDDSWDGVYYECSACGEPWTLIDGTPWDNGMNFCPNCGADMREDGEANADVES